MLALPPRGRKAELVFHDCRSRKVGLQTTGVRGACHDAMMQAALSEPVPEIGVWRAIFARS